MSADFIAAYAGSSVAQAALVAGATASAAPMWTRALRHRAFALIPPISLIGVVVLLRLYPDGASLFAKVALVLVPLLALIAAARVGPAALLLTLAAIGVVLHDGHSLTGQLAALLLIGGSCVLLGALLVDLTPPHWLGAGIAAMAAADLVLVASGVLGPASDVLNAAGVSDHLPQLQRVELGPLEMGYGDVFLPALVGALLASRARPRTWAAGLTLLFALAAGLVFLAFDRLPATVPVALALLVVEAAGAARVWWRRRRRDGREGRRRSSAAVSEPHGMALEHDGQARRLLPIALGPGRRGRQRCLGFDPETLQADLDVAAIDARGPHPAGRRAGVPAPGAADPARGGAGPAGGPWA